MKNSFRPIEEAKKDGTEYLLLSSCRFLGYSLSLGSFRVDGGYSGNKDPLWLDNSYDDYSCGYASEPLDPVGFMEVDYTDFVKEYKEGLNIEVKPC